VGELTQALRDMSRSVSERPAIDGRAGRSDSQKCSAKDGTNKTTRASRPAADISRSFVLTSA